MSVAPITPGPGVTGGGLGVLITALGRQLDALAVEAGRPTAVTSRDVADLERMQRRLASVTLTLIAKADRQDVHKRSGDASISSWLNGATRSGGGQAARQVGLATALEDSLPATKAALGAGDVSTAAAAVIHSVMRKLPDSLTDVERGKVEDKLVDDAKRLDPARLRKQATMALAAAEKSAEEIAQHQESVLVDEETSAYKQSFLTLFDRGDGTSKGSFIVPTAIAQVLRKVLQSMTSPRRDHQKRSESLDAVGGGVAARGVAAGCAADCESTPGDHSGGDGRSFGLPQREPRQCTCGVNPDATSFVEQTAVGRNNDWAALGWPEKNGRAFVDLLEHLDTERLHGKVASTVMVTMTLDQLLGAVRAAELAQLTGVPATPSVGVVRSDGGHHLSTAAARQLACNAGIIPVVLGGASLPLDLGRQERLFTEAQRVALATLYDECATIGCDRPFAWTELHHEDPWSRHGKTDLQKAIPVCRFHHTRLHDESAPRRIVTDQTGKKTVYFGQRC